MATLPDEPQRHRNYLIALLVVLAAGLFLRLPAPLFAGAGTFRALHMQPGFQRIGFDEALYRDYVNALITHGLGGYTDIVDHYIEAQKHLTGSVLPPVRFLYIFAAYVWHSLFGSESLAALHNVASLFSMLTLLLSCVFVWRMKGLAWSLATTALMAFAPTQLHMSQHALVDGFFAFWALLCLWLVWENLRAPRDPRWLVAYVFAWALCVMTKENSFFVFVAIVVILLANRWLKWGTVTRELGLATIVGPLLGVVGLIFVAGGIPTLLTTYQLSVSKNYQLPYAILTGDGPWHRYLVDLLLVSPIILILALAMVFRLTRERKAETFAALFIGASYLLMCNIKYGMNLRYANMWDMPLRLLAVSQIESMAALIPRYRTWLVIGAVTAISVYELRQYNILFVQHPLYELVSDGLLRALQIIKSPGSAH